MNYVGVAVYLLIGLGCAVFSRFHGGNEVSDVALVLFWPIVMPLWGTVKLVDLISGVFS